MVPEAFNCYCVRRRLHFHCDCTANGSICSVTQKNYNCNVRTFLRSLVHLLQSDVTHSLTVCLVCSNFISTSNAVWFHLFFFKKYSCPFRVKRWLADMNSHWLSRDSASLCGKQLLGLQWRLEDIYFAVWVPLFKILFLCTLIVPLLLFSKALLKWIKLSYN